MHIHVFERPSTASNLVWMTYSICIIVVIVDIFVARRFDRHFCLPKPDFSQSRIMDEIGRPESRLLIYLFLWIWIWIWFVQQHINIHDLVCVYVTDRQTDLYLASLS